MSVSFSFVDFLIVLIVVVSAGYAAWRGFLSETLSIFAWVSAAFACLYLGPHVIPLTRGLVSSWWLANVIAYAVVFLAVFIPLAFMSHRFSQSVRNSPIGPLDRALGIVFGVVRGLVIVGAAYIAFTLFVSICSQPHWMREAKLLPAVQATAETIIAVIPQHGPAPAPRCGPDAIEASQPPAARPVPLQQTHAKDPVGDMIRRQETHSASHATPAPVHREQARKAEKRYGAQDRQALDRLFEASGSGK